MGNRIGKCIASLKTAFDGDLSDNSATPLRTCKPTRKPFLDGVHFLREHRPSLSVASATKMASGIKRNLANLPFARCYRVCEGLVTLLVGTRSSTDIPRRRNPGGVKSRECVRQRRTCLGFFNWPQQNNAFPITKRWCLGCRVLSYPAGTRIHRNVTDNSVVCVSKSGQTADAVASKIPQDFEFEATCLCGAGGAVGDCRTSHEHRSSRAPGARTPGSGACTSWRHLLFPSTAHSLPSQSLERRADPVRSPCPRHYSIFYNTPHWGGLFRAPHPLWSPKLLDRFVKFKRHLKALENLSKENKLSWPRGHQWRHRSGQSRNVRRFGLGDIGEQDVNALPGKCLYMNTSWSIPMVSVEPSRRMFQSHKAQPTNQRGSGGHCKP